MQRTLRAGDKSNHELHTFSTLESFEEFVRSCINFLSVGEWSYLLDHPSHDVWAVLEVEVGKNVAESRHVQVTMKLKHTSDDKKGHDVEIDYEKQLDENVYLALGSGAEFFVSPYDATHDDSEVDIDLLYHFDLTKKFKLQLKTHQEPIPCVPLSESHAVGNGLWTYLGESEMDPLGHLLLRENVREFLRSFPKGGLMRKRLNSYRGIHVAKTYDMITPKSTRGVQFRRHPLTNGGRGIIVNAKEVPGYTAKDGVQVVYFRWKGPSLQFLIRSLDDLEQG